MEKPEFKGFFKKKIHVDIYEKKLFKNKYKGSCDIDARQLKTQSEFTKQYKVQLESQRCEPFIEVTFKLRTPCAEKEYDITYKNRFNVTKIFPPFKGENKGDAAIKLEVQAPKVSEVDLGVSVPKITENDLKVAAPKQPEKAKIPPSKSSAANPSVKAEGVSRPTKAPQGKKKPPAVKGPVIDKSEFREEELEDPDNIDSLNSLQVLQFKLDKYEEQRAKIDGRTPRELMQKICKIKCKMNILNESFGDTIGPDDYLAMLKSSFDHDKKLAQYFAQTNQKDKSLLVSERMPIIFKEMESLLKQMKK